MAKYITEDIYVSGVKNDNIALADGSAAPISEAAPAKEEKDFKYSADKKVRYLLPGFLLQSHSYFPVNSHP